MYRSAKRIDMAEFNETFTINLRIGSQIIPLTVKRVEEEIYRAAEKLINERYNYYARHYPKQVEVTYLSMAILDIAVSLKRNENRNDTQPLLEHMAEMLKDVEKALGESE